MNFKWIPLLALLAFPALAQEQWSVGLGLNAQPGDKLSMDSDAKASKGRTIAPALLVGYRALDFGTSDLSITGEYQFKTSSTAKASFPQSGKDYTNLSSRTSTQFFAPGIQWNFHRQVDFGFGIQYRFTQLKDSVSGFHTNYNRPWINAYVGYTFKDQGGLKPFVALRLAASPMTTKAPSYAALMGNSDAAKADMLRSLSQNKEISIQAGIRF